MLAWLNTKNATMGSFGTDTHHIADKEFAFTTCIRLIRSPTSLPFKPVNVYIVNLVDVLTKVKNVCL